MAVCRFERFSVRAPLEKKAGLNLFHDAQIGEYFRVFISCGVIAVSLALYVWKEVAARRRAMERVSGEAR